jgi:hypothetical protein
MLTFTPEHRALLYTKHAPNAYRVQTFFMVKGAAWCGSLAKSEYFEKKDDALAVLNAGEIPADDECKLPDAYFGDIAVRRQDVIRIFTDFSPSTHPQPAPADTPPRSGEEIACTWLEQDYVDTYGPKGLWTDTVRESYEDRLAVLRDFVRACWPNT